MFNQIGGQKAIGSPISPNQIGGENFIRHCGADKLLLDFHEGSGTIVYDKSHCGNNGTFKGAGEPAWVRNGVDFDGANDYINIGSDASIDNIFGVGGTISISICPHSDGQGDNGRIMSKYTAASAVGFLIATILESAGYCKLEFYITFFLGVTAKPGWWKTNNAVIPINTVSVVTICYDSSNASNDPIFYVNGAVVAITESATPEGTVKSDAANNMLLGIFDSSQAYDGIQDETRIWNRILSPLEVQQNYLANKFKGNN